MVTSYPIERTSRTRDHQRPVEKQPRSRHYDSFVVRLWQDEGSDTVLRIEVEHVQAGLSMEAVQVPLDWIVPEISSCLQSATNAQADAHHGGADAR